MARFSPGKKKNVKCSRLDRIRERIRGIGTSTDDSEYLLKCLDKAEAVLREYAYEENWETVSRGSYESDLDGWKGLRGWDLAHKYFVDTGHQE